MAKHVVHPCVGEGDLGRTPEMRDGHRQAGSVEVMDGVCKEFEEFFWRVVHKRVVKCCAFLVEKGRPFGVVW